jgi:hypothetical protein
MKMGLGQPKERVFRDVFALLQRSVLLAGACVAGPVHAQYSASPEYAAIGYENEARSNPVARLLDDLRNGKSSLAYEQPRGYFDALLKALKIDADSQTLVFSRTSLQKERISPQAPRGLFFNDSTYLGLVQNSTIVEVATIDKDLGIVFYTFDNTKGSTKYFERADQKCLVCHDSQGTMGGGVPNLMALSSVYSDRDVPLKNFSGTGNVGDETPIEDRWGGWYVTGRHGVQPHLGNVMLDDPTKLDKLDDYRVWNLQTLKGAGYFDTAAYPRDTSDIVALMVLEHQITVQNQITYLKFKAPIVLERLGLHDDLTAQSWDALSARAQKALTRMADELVTRLVFLDAADLASPISGSKEFVEGFRAPGPKDGAGRSLRELELSTRLFRYPLSYLIYTDGFATLPPYVKDYVYLRLARYLGGAELFAGKSHYSLKDRRAALEILAATEPNFRPYLAPASGRTEQASY